MNKTDASALQGTETNFKLLEAKIEKIGLAVLEENNYYAFGMKHQGYNNVVTATDPALKYKYNGKELQDEMGLGRYDYHARNYDPSLGRWFNMILLPRQWKHTHYMLCCYYNHHKINTQNIINIIFHISGFYFFNKNDNIRIFYD